MLSEKLRRTGRVRLRFSLGSTKALDLEEGGPVNSEPTVTGGLVKVEPKPAEYPAKLYIRFKPVYRYLSLDPSDKQFIGEKSVLPQLDGDKETEVAVYQLVRVSKFKRTVTEQADGEPTFRKVTTEIVEEV